jgi:phenylacetic acid degradation operon negative regulatory protein
MTARTDTNCWHYREMSARADLSGSEIGLRPLTARSIILTLLLAAHPPELPARDLVRAAALFDVAENTLRSALSRMVSPGDLVNTGSVYQLTDRLLARQQRQDDSLRPPMTAWNGDWEFAVVTSVGRTAADRARLRVDLAELRLAELREGVWLRPANLIRGWPSTLDSDVRRFVGQPASPATELPPLLWDLAAWSDVGHALLTTARRSADPAHLFTIAAAIVRHLRSDPFLPAELAPPGWPAEELRSTYLTTIAELLALARSATDS